MSNVEVDDRFSAALRAELVARVQHPSPSWSRSLWIRFGVIAAGAGLVGGAAIGGIAASQPQGVSKASEIVPAMAAAQQPSDMLPTPAANTFGKSGIDLGSSRYLGKGTTLRYYAVSKGTDLICLIPVGPDGSGKSMGCTRIKGFDTYGLRTGNPEGSEEAWLIMPNSSQVAMAKDPSGKWIVEADNFLVKESPAQ
ncbi:hypothetical protein [Sinomonas gamaensis]|uniref:hypothetical protein n=1 Tax=Sinomonas gamaensis TaxID=2565624 RepID=UPI0011098240|nr:hypothetical protein [Sinomonas gamaensis]